MKAGLRQNNEFYFYPDLQIGSKFKTENKISDQNVIPSAPSLYPQLPDDFRLKKICNCQKEIEIEISHYLKVLKKYKRAKSVPHNSSTFAGLTSATLTASGLAISLRGVGIIAHAPLTSVAALSGFIAAAFSIVSKNLSKNISKHKNTISLVEAEHQTMIRLISKALNDGSISDAEFNLILHEIEQYHEMKKRLRTKAKTFVEKPDIKALKEERKKQYQKNCIVDRWKTINIHFE